MLDGFPRARTQLEAIQELHPDLMPDVVFCLRDSEEEGEVEIIIPTHIHAVFSHLFQLCMQPTSLPSIRPSSQTPQVKM